MCTSHLDPDVEHDDMFHELYEDDIIVCPFCTRWSPFFKSIKNEICVTHPMVWCEHFGALSVILTTVYKLTTPVEIIKKLPEVHSQINEVLLTKPDKTGDESIILFNLSKILKISNHNCCQYMLTAPVYYTPHLNKLFIPPIANIVNDYLQFSEHEMRKFLTSTYFEKNTMIDKYNIFDCGNNSSDNCPKCNPKFWNM